MTRQKKLTFFTASYAQASVVFPFVMVSPAYFADVIQLGGLMQTANAFGQVQGALSVFVKPLSQPRGMARGDRAPVRLRSVGGHRPRGRGDAAGDRRCGRRSGGGLVQGPGGAAAERRAAGQRQRHSFGPGEHVLVSGPSGAGKSTLFRALAGIWPFGAGTITVPKNARVMILPQRPYFPIAPLAAAVAYPAEPAPTTPPGRRADRRGRLAGVGRPGRGGGALEPHAVARRAAAARHRPRHPARAGLSVPRRGHRLARRAGGGRALPSAADSGCQPRPSCRSATARRSPPSIAAGWRSAAKATATN